MRLLGLFRKCHLVTLIIGGRLSSNIATAETHFYHAEEDRWQSGPRLKSARSHHDAAFVVDRTTGERSLVVAGGYANRGALDSVEILHSNSNAWIRGPKLPARRNALAMVHVNMDIIAIGGHDGSTWPSDMFRYFCSNGSCQWTRMTQTLRTPRNQVAVISVPNSLTDCH